MKTTKYKRFDPSRKKHTGKTKALRTHPGQVIAVKNPR